MYSSDVPVPEVHDVPPLSVCPDVHVSEAETEAAFAWLLPVVRRLARRLFPQDPDELEGEGLLAAWRAWQRVQSRQYALVAARNAMTAYCRLRAVRAPFVLSLEELRERVVGFDVAAPDESSVCDIESDPLIQAALRILERQEKVTQVTLARELGIHQSTASRMLKRLRASL